MPADRGHFKSFVGNMGGLCLQLAKKATAARRLMEI